MSRKLIFIIFLVLLLMLLPVFVYFFSLDSGPSTETLKMETNVTVSRSTVGIDTSTLGVVFGKVPLNGTGKRFVNLNNTKEFSQRVEFFVTGNISDFIYLSDNNITLKPGDSKTIDATFISLEGRHPYFEDEIFYSGEILAVFTRIK